MKLSLNWIRDFVSLPEKISAEELAKKITLSVCEVEQTFETGQHLQNIFVAQVVEINPHPNADKLKLVTINAGHKTEKVVCGAKNYKLNDKVAFADLGTKFPDGLEIKPVKLRGVESKGMLCSKKELGFSEDHDGLMILDSSLDVGKTLAEVYPDNLDLIFEVDNKSITHRPDLWGHYGFARELAILFESKLNSLSFEPAPTPSSQSNFEVIDELGASMRRYTGIGLVDVEVKESPLFIQHRLHRVDLRPINNVVDITNYVMAALGQPMHAFDVEKLTGNKLIIRKGRTGDKLVHLYEKEVELDDRDMLICDANQPVSLAGVIGGLNSGVSTESKNIFFEAANWDPTVARKTATRLNIRTDALQRFEKNLDPELTDVAIQMAVQMLLNQQNNFSISTPLFDIYNHKFVTSPILLKTKFVHSLLGTNIGEENIQKILESLGFELIKNEDGFEVNIPSWRNTKDISIATDLVEEIGRIYGYNNIKAKAPLFPIESPKTNLLRKDERKAKSFFVSNGFHELYTYPLINKNIEEFLDLDFDSYQIKNPMSETQTFLRRSLLPQHLEKVRDNLKSLETFKLFEIGRVYRKEGNESIEKDKLIFSITDREKSLESLFFEAKTYTQNLFYILKTKSFVANRDEQSSEIIHPYISLNYKIAEAKVASIYALSPQLREKSKVGSNSIFVEIDFQELMTLGKSELKYKNITKFPPVHFRVSVVCSEKTYFNELKELVSKVDQRVEQVSFGDVFSLPNKPGFKSTSIDIDFRSSKSTLTPEEIEDLQNRVVAALSNAGFPLKEME